MGSKTPPEDNSPLSQQRTTRLLRRLTQAGKDARMLKVRLNAAQKAEVEPTLAPPRRRRT